MLKAGRRLAFCCMQRGEAALEVKEHQKRGKPSAGLGAVGHYIWRSETGAARQKGHVSLM